MEKSPAHDIGFLLKAIHFASRKHRDQRRKDAEASPYINHPIALTDVLFHEGGVDDPVVLVAAILHDTVEDTGTTPEEIAAIFGQEVADIVMEVTDDKSLPWQERKHLQIEHAPHASPRAKLVKLADKICNLRDLAASPPPDWPESRKAQYREWSRQVVEGLRGTNAALEAAFDEACRKHTDASLPSKQESVSLKNRS